MGSHCQVLDKKHLTPRRSSTINHFTQEVSSLLAMCTMAADHVRESEVKSLLYPVDRMS